MVSLSHCSDNTCISYCSDNTCISYCSDNTCISYDCSTLGKNFLCLSQDILDTAGQEEYR